MAARTARGPRRGTFARRHPVAPYDDTHSHRLPRSLLPLVLICVAGLVASVLIVWHASSVAAAQSARTEQRLAALEEYVAGKGEERDAETARQNERLNRFVCDVLDQLPPGRALDRVRVNYQCGPGLIP